MPRRNVLQPRLTVRTVAEQRASQLGLPLPAVNSDVHDGSLGVESLFDAEALAAFESRMTAQKNQIADIHHPHPAMQETEFNGGTMQDPAQARFYGQPSNNLSNNLSSPDLEQFYPTAPDPNLNFHTEKITPPYTPSWRTTHRSSNK